MNVRGVLGVTALVAAFLLAGLGVSLAGAALWKGTLPGEGPKTVAAATPVRSVPIATVPASGAATGAGQTGSQGRPGAGATTPPATRAAVAELIVCDASVDCGENPNRREWDSVSACVRVQGGDNRPLVLAITTEGTSPAGATRTPIVARSDEFQAGPTLACHAVRVLRGTLPAGDYWMWLLEGSTVLSEKRFRLGR